MFAFGMKFTCEYLSFVTFEQHDRRKQIRCALNSLRYANRNISLKLSLKLSSAEYWCPKPTPQHLPLQGALCRDWLSQSIHFEPVSHREHGPMLLMAVCMPFSLKKNWKYISDENFGWEIDVRPTIVYNLCFAVEAAVNVNAFEWCCHRSGGENHFSAFVRFSSRILFSQI